MCLQDLTRILISCSAPAGEPRGCWEGHGHVSDEKRHQFPLPEGSSRVGTGSEFVANPNTPHRIEFVAVVSSARQNEDGAVEVCGHLVTYLNSIGGQWAPPTRSTGPENGIDAIATAPGAIGYFQVTRAMHDQEFWRTLGVHKSVRAYTTREDMAQDLWESITHKANSIPTANRKTITLVLDATELFAHHSIETVKVFLDRFGQAWVNIGFDSIWVVGGHHTFVTKLA